MPHLLPWPRTAMRNLLRARDDVIGRDAWSEYQDEMTTLDATIIDNNAAGSDPTLQVRATDGYNWTIELAKHTRNAEVGLTSQVAGSGDRVRVHGLLSHRLGESRIKALRLTIGDRVFDLYPELLVQP